MWILELRELSFKKSYPPLVYPTFFLCVFPSHRSFSFQVLFCGGDGQTRFFKKILPDEGGVEIFLKTGGLTLSAHQSPELPLHLVNEMRDAIWKKDAKWR